MVSLLLQKAPLSSYITFGGKSEFMMTTINGTQPLNFYRSTDNTRWKVRIFDLLIRDPIDKWAFYRMDEKGQGQNFADATVDTFYRAILIPTNQF